MSVRKIIALHGLVLGGIFGALVSYATVGSSLKAVVIGGVIGAVVGGALPFIPVEAWDGLFSLGELLHCCSIFGVLFITGVATIGGFVLLRSVFAAALIGTSARLLMFFGLMLLNLIASQRQRALSR